jgi:hypothetical protein
MKKFYPLLLLVVVLTGCASNANVPTPPQVVSTNTTVNTETPLPPTITPTPQATPTATNPYLSEQCLPVLESIPADLDTQGVLVMQNEKADPPSKEVYILDMKTNKSVLANQPLEGIYSGDVSPDGKWITYRRFFWDSNGKSTDRTDFVIASVDGQQDKLVPKEIIQEDPSWLLSQWLDNTHLLIGLNTQNPKIQGTLTVLVWDPFSGTKRVIRPELPVLYDTQLMAPFPSWGYGVVVYNPALTRALYLYAEDSSSAFQYALWDMEKREGIATFPLLNERIIPRWSPDGSKVAIVGYAKRDEIFFIQENGQQSQLTNIEDSYEYLAVNNLYWSPDGSHIAFSLWTKLSDNDKKGEESIDNLAVADVATGKVTNYCIPIGRHHPKIRIVWSPDGRQLIVRDESVADTSRLILVDIERGIAVQVAENMELFGWMVPQE